MLALEERFMVREMYRRGVRLARLPLRLDEMAKPFGKSSLPLSSRQPGNLVK